jgi:hypothetical protein
LRATVQQDVMKAPRPVPMVDGGKPIAELV